MTTAAAVTGTGRPRAPINCGGESVLRGGAKESRGKGSESRGKGREGEQGEGEVGTGGRVYQPSGNVNWTLEHKLEEGIVM